MCELCPAGSLMLSGAQLTVLDALLAGDVVECSTFANMGSVNSLYDRGLLEPVGDEPLTGSGKVSKKGSVRITGEGLKTYPLAVRKAGGETLYISLGKLKKERGWTDKLVQDFLGPECLEATNPRFSSASPMRLWFLDKVREVERSAEFRAKFEARRRTADKAAATRAAKKSLEAANVELERLQAVERDGHVSHVARVLYTYVYDEKHPDADVSVKEWEQFGFRNATEDLFLDDVVKLVRGRVASRYDRERVVERVTGGPTLVEAAGRLVENGYTIADVREACLKSEQDGYPLICYKDKTLPVVRLNTVFPKVFADYNKVDDELVAMLFVGDQQYIDLYGLVAGLDDVQRVFNSECLKLYAGLDCVSDEDVVAASRFLLWAKTVVSDGSYDEVSTNVFDDVFNDVSVLKVPQKSVANLVHMCKGELVKDYDIYQDLSIEYDNLLSKEKMKEVSGDRKLSKCSFALPKDVYRKTTDVFGMSGLNRVRVKNLGLVLTFDDPDKDVMEAAAGAGVIINNSVKQGNRRKISRKASLTPEFKYLKVREEDNHDVVNITEIVSVLNELLDDEVKIRDKYKVNVDHYLDRLNLIENDLKTFNDTKIFDLPVLPESALDLNVPVSCGKEKSREGFADFLNERNINPAGYVAEELTSDIEENIYRVHKRAYISHLRGGGDLRFLPVNVTFYRDADPACEDVYAVPRTLILPRTIFVDLMMLKDVRKKPYSQLREAALKHAKYGSFKRDDEYSLWLNDYLKKNGETELECEHRLVLNYIRFQMSDYERIVSAERQARKRRRYNRYFDDDYDYDYDYRYEYEYSYNFDDIYHAVMDDAAWMYPNLAAAVQRAYHIQDQWDEHKRETSYNRW